MKSLAKTTLALMALLAVSACSMGVSEDNAYSTYDYTASDTALDYPVTTDLIHMN